MAQDSEEDFYLHWRHCETPGILTLCNLRKLLNKFQRQHKEHVCLYTSGYLNPNNLYKPPRKKVSYWTNAQSSWPGRSSPRPPCSPKVAQMRDALVHFTLNTALTPPDTQGTRLFRNLNLAPLAAPHPPEEEEVPILEGGRGPVSPERSHKENLRWPEMKVLKKQQCGQCPGKDEYQYVSAYLAGITKRDQYQQFLHFQRDVLATKDRLSSGFTGAKTVSVLEKKLEEGLQKVCTCDAQDFNRLHVYEEIFDAICQSSLIFGDLLQEIKNEYELYMMILLHSQPIPRYQALRAHVRAMKSRTLKTEEVGNIREELKALVKVLKAALEHNDKLREELESERALLQLTKEGAGSFEKNQMGDENLTHVQKIETKRCEILKKWDELKVLEKEIKTNMTHIGALNIADNRLKSIEAETQKLEIEIKILEKNIAVTKHNLKQSMVKNKISEKKQQKLWMFIEEFMNLDKMDDDSEVIREMISEASE